MSEKTYLDLVITSYGERASATEWGQELTGAAQRELAVIRSRITALDEENERRGDALREIAEWAKAYPLEAFPDLDLKRAKEVPHEFYVAQALLCKRRIIDKLTALGFYDAIELECVGLRVILDKVKISCMNASAMGYVLQVTHWPRGVRILALAQDSVLTDLSVAVGHPVRSEIKRVGNSIIGLCYTVEIAEQAKAYPLDVFPEPDLKRADEVLRAAGMSIDAISASAMRHVVKRVAEIAAAALLHKPETT